LSLENSLLKNDAHLHKLQSSVPVLFNLLTLLKEKFPFKEMKNCLSVLHQKVFDPFLKVFDPFLKGKCPSEDAVEEDGLGFSPSLSMIRQRGMFVVNLSS
jgi:hypothetical protein